MWVVNHKLESCHESTQCATSECAVKSLIHTCLFIIYGMRFWHWLKEVSNLWFCHVLFFFSTLVYKKMLSFLNLALLWKIDSPEGKKSKASFSVIQPLCVMVASLPSIFVSEGCAARLQHKSQSKSQSLQQLPLPFWGVSVPSCTFLFTFK